MSLNLGTLFLTVDVGGTQRINSVSRALGGLHRTAIATAAAILSIKTVGFAKELTDGAIEADNQLKLGSKTLNEYKNAQEGVRKISVETGTGLEANALLYSRMTRATRDLNLSEKDRLRITETVSKSVALGGSNTAEATGAIRQFTQALGGDFKTSSQELNSVLEQTPGLANTLATGLGVPTNQLKVLAKEGKLSTEIVINALKKMGPDVDKQFSNVSFSFGKSLTVMEGGLGAFLDDVNTKLGASQAFHNFANNIGNALLNPQFVKQAAVVSEEWVNGFVEIGNEAKSTFTFIEGGWKKIRDVVNQTFGLNKKDEEEFFNSVFGYIKNLPQTLATLFGIIGTEFKAVATLAVTALMTSFDVIKATGQETADKLYTFFSTAFDIASTRIKLIWSTLMNYMERDLNGVIGLLNHIPGVNIKFHADTTESDAAINKLQKQLDDLHAKRNKGYDAATAEADKNRLKALNIFRETMGQVNDERMKALTKIINLQTTSVQRAKEEVAANQKAADSRFKGIDEKSLKKATVDVQKFGKTLQATLGQGLRDSLSQGWTGIRDDFKNMLLKMATDAIAANITKYLIGGGGVPGAGNLVQQGITAFAGMMGFAGGGDPPINRPSIIGEHGPEIFVPRQSGTIIPNSALGGNKTFNFNLNMNANASKAEIQKSASQLAREVKRQLAQV